MHGTYALALRESVKKERIMTKEEFDAELDRIRRENSKSFVILRSMQEAQERINYIALGNAEVRDFVNSDPAMLVAIREWLRAGKHVAMSPAGRGSVMLTAGKGLFS
jgi:hypothetical protein